MKLNILLAVTDALRIKYKNMVNDYTKFFKDSGGAFIGAKHTYEAKPDTIDDPARRGIKRVVTTVDEKFDYFIAESKEFIDALFAQERTNAMGFANADLVVDGVVWGNFSSLELLRLKSLIEASDLGNLEQMLSRIPVRKEDVNWHECTEPEYEERAIFQSPLVTGTAKTTIKEQYILADPNVQSGNAKTYTPQIGIKTTTQELGDYTTQTFSGEWTHKQRALTLKRRNTLLLAVTKALKECNEVEAAISGMDAERIFNYLFGR